MGNDGQGSQNGGSRTTRQGQGATLKIGGTKSFIKIATGENVAKELEKQSRVGDTITYKRGSGGAHTPPMVDTFTKIGRNKWQHTFTMGGMSGTVGTYTTDYMWNEEMHHKLNQRTIQRWSYKAK